MPIYELKTIMTSITTIPTEYVCPILTEIMEQPVLDFFGYSYEKVAMEQWFK